MKTRPALGPKGLIILTSVNPVCGMPLFSEARLLLVITVHDILHYFVVHCTLRPQSQFQDVALLHVISCTRYGTVLYRICVEIRYVLRLNLLLYSALYNVR